MTTNDKVGKSYLFFLEKEKSGKPFDMIELVAYTGWKTSTIKTYPSKKWSSFLQKTQHGYVVKGISSYTEDGYRRLMSQVLATSQEPHKPRFTEDVEGRIAKARESALLAMDIFNRPATTFRSEGFIVMMIIAWTSLFHAIFERDGIKYNYTEKDGSDKKTKDGDSWYFELGECTKTYFKGKQNSVWTNLDFMAEVRHKVEHRYIPKLDNVIVGECQAILLNFDELLVKEFGDYFALRDLLAFPLQTSILTSSGKLEATKKLQSHEYDEVREFIDTFRKGLTDEVYNDPKFSFQIYLIPKTANNRNSADMAIEFVRYDPSKPEEMEKLEQVTALIKEKKLRTGNPDGLKPGDVVKNVAAQLGRKFTMHNHMQAWKMYECRPVKATKKEFANDNCYYDAAHNDFIYTPNWVNFLVRKLSDYEEYKKLIAFKPKQ